MRKLLGTIVVCLFIVVGFTGVDLTVNGQRYQIPPFIKNLFEDKKEREEIINKTKKTINKAANEVKEATE